MYDNYMSYESDWKRLRKSLVEQGLRVELSNRQHWKVYRGKELITTMPSSPGGGRGLPNKRAELRRKGVNI